MLSHSPLHALSILTSFLSHFSVPSSLSTFPPYVISIIPFPGSLPPFSSQIPFHLSPSLSLSGLVAMIKEHITKPTAMAQGRVSHLIEWNSWGGRCERGDDFQEDEQLYSHLTDEIKEARFAAG